MGAPVFRALDPPLHVLNFSLKQSVLFFGNPTRCCVNVTIEVFTSISSFSHLPLRCERTQPSLRRVGLETAGKHSWSAAVDLLRPAVSFSWAGADWGWVPLESPADPRQGQRYAGRCATPVYRCNEDAAQSEFCHVESIGAKSTGKVGQSVVTTASVLLMLFPLVCSCDKDGRSTAGEGWGWVRFRRKPPARPSPSPLQPQWNSPARSHSSSVVRRSTHSRWGWVLSHTLLRSSTAAVRTQAVWSAAGRAGSRRESMSMHGKGSGPLCGRATLVREAGPIHCENHTAGAPHWMILWQSGAGMQASDPGPL